MNLGVYVTTLNEEVLIGPVLEAVLQVFPQVEVIDIGSEDNTLAMVASFNVRVRKHTLPEAKYKGDHATAQAYTDIKNVYASKHDWVFFIDGDEIYNEENLLKIKEEAASGEYTAYRIGWKTLRKTRKGKQVGNTIINGPKLYKTSDYEFRRGWPNEVLQHHSEEKDNREPKQECGVWCWHGVLLDRTLSIREHTARKKKRHSKRDLYDETLVWTDIKEWPWTS